MSTIPAKHIIKNLAAPVRVNGLNVSGASSTITSSLTTALGTAGEGGLSVPLQVSASGSVVGVIVAAPGNRVEVYDATTKDKIASAAGDEVYGRLTEAAGVYTLNYFTLPDSGTEVGYTFSSSRLIDFEFNYRFDFRRFPSDGFINIQTRNVSQDVALFTGNLFAELITVTALNTLTNLSKTPAFSTTLFLFVNGIAYDTFGGENAAFSVNLGTRALTWNAVGAGFSLETTDRVIAQYATRE